MPRIGLLYRAMYDTVANFCAAARISPDSVEDRLDALRRQIRPALQVGEWKPRQTTDTAAKSLARYYQAKRGNLQKMSRGMQMSHLPQVLNNVDNLGDAFPEAALQTHLHSHGRAAQWTAGN
jgi:hypothetical protein